MLERQVTEEYDTKAVQLEPAKKRERPPDKEAKQDELSPYQQVIAKTDELAAKRLRRQQRQPFDWF